MSEDTGNETSEPSGARATLLWIFSILAGASALAFLLLLLLTSGGLGPDRIKLFDATTTFALTVGSLLATISLGLVARALGPSKEERRRALVALAQERGLSFSDEDPDLCALRLERFRSGKKQLCRCRNVLSGRVRGIAVQACELKVVLRADIWGSDDEILPRQLDFICAVARVQGGPPKVLIEARGTANVQEKLAGQLDLSAEDPHLDRLYRVKYADSRFARHLLNREVLRAWILAEPRWNWEIGGEYVACWRDAGTAGQFAAAIDAVVGLVERLPDLDALKQTVGEEHDAERRARGEPPGQEQEEDESRLDRFKRGALSMQEMGDHLIARYRAANSDVDRDRYLELLAGVDFDRAQSLRMDEALRPRSPRERR